MRMPVEKNLSLEALRGVASLIVLFHHFILGFLPLYHGVIGGTNGALALAGTIWFASINGTAAVCLFFVLSGHVLTAAFFSHGSTAGLWQKAVSRYPRLFVPIMASLLLSYGLFQLNLMRFQDAAQLSGSDWLANFAYGFLEQSHQPTLADVAQSSVWGVIFGGDAKLNTNLWTMKIEYLGSLLAYAVTFFLCRHGRAFAFLMLLAVSLAVVFIQPYLIAFLAGVAIARFRLHMPNGPMSLTAFLAGLYLFGYYYDEQHYAVFARLPLEAGMKRVLLHTLAAALIICAVLRSGTPAGRLRSISIWLGRISFPLYLVHTLVIASFSSQVYVAVTAWKPGGPVLLITALATLVALVPLVFLFMKIDRQAITLARKTEAHCDLTAAGLARRWR